MLVMFWTLSRLLSLLRVPAKLSREVLARTREDVLCYKGLKSHMRAFNSSCVWPLLELKGVSGLVCKCQTTPESALKYKHCFPRNLSPLHYLIAELK